MKKILVIIIFILIAQFFLSSKTVAYGDSVSVLEKKAASINDLNQQFELQIASLVSCSNIAQKAEDAGFIAVTTSMPIKVDFSLALRE